MPRFEGYDEWLERVARWKARATALAEALAADLDPAEHGRLTPLGCEALGVGFVDDGWRPPKRTEDERAAARMQGRDGQLFAALADLGIEVDE